jgi:hypothetical protein
MAKTGIAHPTVVFAQENQPLQSGKKKKQQSV